MRSVLHGLAAAPVSTDHNVGAYLIVVAVVLVVVGMARPPLIPDLWWRFFSWALACGIGLWALVRLDSLPPGQAIVGAVLVILLLLAGTVIEMLLKERRDSKSEVVRPDATLPEFAVENISGTFSYEDGRLMVGIANGNPTIPDATLNLLVPDRLASIARLDQSGIQALGSQLTTSEPLDGNPSIYWAEVGLRLRGRLSQLLRFELGNRQPGTYPVVLRLVADELPDRVDILGEFTIPPDDGVATARTAVPDTPDRPFLDEHDDVYQLRQAIAGAQSVLKKQRRILSDWKLIQDGLLNPNDRGNWEATGQKNFLLKDHRFSMAFRATEDALEAIALIHPEPPRVYNDLREEAIVQIDAALPELARAYELLEPTPEAVSEPRTSPAFPVVFQAMSLSQDDQTDERNSRIFLHVRAINRSDDPASLIFTLGMFRPDVRRGLWQQARAPGAPAVSFLSRAAPSEVPAKKHADLTLEFLIAKEYVDQVRGKPLKYEDREIPSPVELEALRLRVKDLISGASVEKQLPLDEA